MPPQSRAARREDLTARVVAVGRRHLGEHGAAALSLRAVTRELGMVSSAVYRYVANRDELLTLLVVDAYTEQADGVDAAVAQAGDRPWDQRLLAGALAFRAWGVAEPARYALLYGSPVPGYAAPPEITIAPGTRVLTTLLALVAEGVASAEVVDGPSGVALTGPLAADLARVAHDVGLPAGPDVLARAVSLWACLVGSVSLEVFGQYGTETFTEAAALFEHHVCGAIAHLRGVAGP